MKSHADAFLRVTYACGFQKLFRNDDGAFEVVDFVWIVVHHCEILPFSCLMLLIVVLLFLSTLWLYCIKSTVRKIGQIEKCVFFQFEYI